MKFCALAFVLLIAVAVSADGCYKCSLGADPGPCKGSILRWYYNTKTMKCELFVYGGCEGNANNYKTLRDCQASCTDCDLHICIEPPCFSRTCHAHPEAVCYDNYCGGCFVDWYIGAKKVDCKVSTSTHSDSY